VIGTGFEIPQFSPWMVGYTVIGAAIFWGKNGRTKLKIFFLSYAFDMVKFPEGRLRQILELLVFLVLGCFIGIGISHPSNVPQAISAGMAWTGFLAKRV